MPELPEVETVVRTLRKQQLEQHSIISTELFFDKLLKNKGDLSIIRGPIDSLRRRGKWIVLKLVNGASLCLHLGMEGKLFLVNNGTPLHKHTRFLLQFDQNHRLMFNDSRKFGRLYVYEPGQSLSCLESLGLEPWDERLTTLWCEEHVGKSMPIKLKLLDQHFIVGIGNIYANEICFQCGIDPHRETSSLTSSEWTSIIYATQQILSIAIANGGTTIKSFKVTANQTGHNQQNLKIYGKQFCDCCHQPLQCDKLGGRSTYWCPHCQK